tara:strand:+ start:4224 stop:5135 length:912 start_codon:yes stop_codon:yes gene_type:complete
MEKNFNQILKEIDTLNFQEKNKKIIFPKNLCDLPNLIIYGPQNSGKYYYSLSIIKNYSNNQLSSQKRLEITINKESEYFKGSDIHYEIDFYLLGTSAKNIWYNFYNHISDILMTKEKKECIILIKNFHEIHEDLLNIFYSFLQNNNQYISIKYILLTQQHGFIPKNIKNRCVTLKCKIPNTSKLNKNDNYYNNYIFYDNHIEDTNELISFIINFKENYLFIKKDKENLYKTLRDIIYNILIKNYNIYNITNHIIFTLIEMDLIVDHEKLLQNNYNFIKYYNNNYRPIYHLEKFAFDLIDNLKN